MTIYFCAGKYLGVEPNTWEFKIVKEGESKEPLVYAATDFKAAQRLYSLCSHHSGLYKLEGCTALLVAPERDGYIEGLRLPNSVKLTLEQMESIVQGLKDPWR